MLQARLAVESSPFMWDPVALAEVVDDDGGSLRIGSREPMEQVRPRPRPALPPLCAMSGALAASAVRGIWHSGHFEAWCMTCHHRSYELPAHAQSAAGALLTIASYHCRLPTHS